MFRFFFILIFVGGFFVSVGAHALSITNKSKHPLLIIVKQDDFGELTRLLVSPKSTEHYYPPDGFEGLLHFETYLKDSPDPTGAPEFLHNVKASDKVCLPKEKCMKKLQRGK